jgi:hypothetical protein
MSPYETFKSNPKASACLKAGIIFGQLDVQTARMNDNDCALALNKARKKLFQAISSSMEKQQAKTKVTITNQAELGQRQNIQIQTNYVQTHFWIGIY